MKGARTVLIIGLISVLASYVLGWYAAGGPNTRLALDDPRVKACFDYIILFSSQGALAQGTVERAWLSSDSRGYRVNLVIELNGYPWLATVTFSDDGFPLDLSVKLSGGFPVFLQRFGLAMLALWLIAGQILPRLFLPKCPDCQGSLWRPAYLETVEGYVYPGGFDDGGDSLPPILRIDHVCPDCGYRRVTYRAAPEYRVGKVFRSVMTSRPISINNEEFAQSVLDKWWETNPKEARFHTQDEWKAFYEELRASEHEERSKK
jgi:hypothetical protein